MSNETFEGNSIEELAKVKVKEPNHIKVYTEFMSKVSNLTRINIPVIFELLQEINANDIIILNPYNKNKICEKLDIRIQSLDNILHSLTKPQEILGNTGVFIKIYRGVLKPNPILFSNKNWADTLKEIDDLGLRFLLIENN